MPVSSLGFFNELNQNYPKMEGTDAQQRANLLINHIKTIRNKLSYKDLTETDMAYVVNINNQDEKKHNLALLALKSDTNLKKANKKQKYLEYLLHNLYFIELQALVYRGYGKKEELNALNKSKAIKQQIINLLANIHKKDKKIAKSFWLYCEQYWEDFKAFLSEFLSISRLIQFIGNAHLWRIALVFARITFQEALLTFSRIDFFIDLLTKHPNNYGGLEITVDNLIQFINNTKVIFNSLSVALPFLRLIFHLALFIKHSRACTPEERLLASETRMWREFKKRYYVLGNDIVWTGINFITNFNTLCRITANNAMVITVAFMFFDLLWMLPGWYFAFEEYKEQKHLLEGDLAGLYKNSPEYAIVFNNLKQLDINWQAKNDTYLYSVFATAFFALGFIAATLIPAIAIPGYFMCTFAMALNLVGGEFSSMREKKLALDLTPMLRNRVLNQEQAILKAEYEIARNNFYITLAVYTLIPTVTMGVFALCWPAAIPLAAAFILFQCLYPKWKAHQQESIDNMRKEQKTMLLENVFEDSEQPIASF